VPSSLSLALLELGRTCIRVDKLSLGMPAAALLVYEARTPELERGYLKLADSLKQSSSRQNMRNSLQRCRFIS